MSGSQTLERTTVDTRFVTDEIDRAEEIIRQPQSLVLPTNIFRDEELSEKYQADVWLVSELHQSIGAYKIRGAYNYVANLSPSKKERGVIIPSAGNAALGIVESAAEQGVDVTVFMSQTAPYQKVDRVQKAAGGAARVVLAGMNFDETLSLAQKECVATGAVLAHPFDDLHVIAGQGTLGREVVNELPDLDVAMVPIGGGGLVSGVGVALKHHNAGILTVGVEPAKAASMKAAFEAGKPVSLNGEFDTFVDGAAVKRVGELTFALARQVVDRLVPVSNSDLRRTTTNLWERPYPIRAELAGALAVSGLERVAERIRGKQVACIVSGGNLSRERYDREVRLAA